jgi:uncharacterized membrane protein
MRLPIAALVASTVLLPPALLSAHRAHRRDAGAPAAASRPAASADEPEEVDVEPVGGPAQKGAPKSSDARRPPRLSATQLVGRLHPALVHLPIAWLVLLVLVELGSLIRRRQEWERTGLWLLLLAVASAIPAIATGLLRAEEMLAEAPEAAGLALRHRNLMFGAAGAAAVALALRLARRPPRGAWRALYLAIVLAAAGLVGYGAHLGAKMVFGVDYLPF